MGDGDVRLITEHRLDALMFWAQANLGQVASKRCITGGSMGGWGCMTYGMRRPHLFAAVYADRPRWRYANSAGTVAVANFDSTTLEGVSATSAPNVASTDGGGKYADHVDLIAYVSNPANKVPPILWCCGSQDGFMPFSDSVAAVAALRAAGRAFAFAWNNGGHATGSIMAQLFDSYPYGTYEIGRGYPLFTEHSLDKNPSVDASGEINGGLSFRNVVESSSGWSCEVTSLRGPCTVKVRPISETFLASVSAKTVTVPAANTWVSVSFTA